MFTHFEGEGFVGLQDLFSKNAVIKDCVQIRTIM